MRRNLVPAMLFAAALAAALAACSGAPEMDEAMKRDLESASAGSIEMLPRGAGLKTVSAIEQHDRQTPTVAPVRRTTAPARTPRQELPQVTEQPRVNEPAAIAPVSAPRVQPPPPGGYKSVGEVIRNAPFPIKP